MTWTSNAAMFWWDGNEFVKVTDHNRSALSVSVERIEKKSRMANGTLRRYTVAKKRTWSCSWDMIPSKNGVIGSLSTVDGGMAGNDIEDFHDNTDGAFLMQLRQGDGTVETVTVMITDFSKDTAKRGPGIDFLNISITLEEA